MMVAVAAPRSLRLPPLADIETERAERRLRHFVRGAWHVVEPFARYQDNWHIHAICDHLEAVERGEVRNLLVTMPPRMMKSLTISVFYPAWRWIARPGMRFLYASYSQTLATDHSLATRRVIESDWYQARWADRFELAGDQNLKTRFENDRRGARISTSVGGVVTGQGGDRLIVDDPHNVREAESDAVREATIIWWDQAMSTRLNDPKTGARIVVMQRVHAADLAGHLIEQGGYVHLNLPMEYEPESVVYTGFGAPDPRTDLGELLAPGRIGPAEVADLKVRLGARAYAGQFQQRPTPAEGAILKRAWWRYYRPAELPSSFERRIQVWDTAFKTGQHNDYSVCATWGLTENGFYLLDLWRDKVEFPDLKRAVVDQHAKHQPDEILVEDAASGQSLIQALRNETRLPIITVKPDRDKVARVNAVSPLIEARKAHLPAGAPWTEEFVEEHAAFPAGAHDDIVDTTSMALDRLNAKQAGTAVAPMVLTDSMFSNPFLIADDEEAF